MKIKKTIAGILSVTCTIEKVYNEFMLYAIGRNINKYHCFLYEKIRKFEGKTEQKAAWKNVRFKMPGASFCS